MKYSQAAKLVWSRVLAFGVIAAVVLSIEPIARPIIPALSSFVHFMARIVPTVASTGQCSAGSGRLMLLASIQWTLFPIYLGCYFAYIPPLSKTVRERLAKRSKDNRLVLLCWLLLIGAALLGELGLIPHVGAFYNGAMLTSKNGLKSVCSSNVLLTLFNIVGPVCEAFAIWSFIVIALNFKAIFLSRRRDTLS